MKKFLICALCIVLSVCTALTASAVQTDDVPSREVISDEASGAVNYAAYVKNTLAPKYGWANTDIIDTTISRENYNHTWAKRKGILGYDTADMNGDGRDEMLVYILGASGNDNSIVVEYYTSDSFGNISKKSTKTVYKKDEDLMKYYATAKEHCVGGIIERNGKKCLLVESWYMPELCIDYQINYSVYECDSKGDFIKSYEIKMGHDFDYSNVSLFSYNSNGTYSLKKIKSEFYETGYCPTFYRTLVSLGFPDEAYNTQYIYFYVPCYVTGMICTYFSTDYEDKSFYLVSAVMDYNNSKSFGVRNCAGVYTFREKEPAEVVTPPAALGNGTKYGDLDGDDNITSADSLLILRASVKLENLNAKQTKLADVNRDGSVDSSDSLEVLRYSVGLSSNKYINTKA